MNDLDIRKQVHQAVDDMTKTAKEDPWLAQRILAQEKGEQPMARKISASMVIAIVLIIISLSAALAAGLGVMVPQTLEPTDTKVPCFTALDSQTGVTIWGYKAPLKE